jgi:exonuclease SbcC
MIPIKLELTNFLSYRETAVLEFDGIHLACISGLNGAGKSSILDGITWALFGESRSKSDDDVVNRLAAVRNDTAEVKFIFQLEGSTYRVIRRKQARKATVLELQVAGDGDRWKALSESKVRETQAAIENLLSMNYDTFSNASFLLQGKADEFTMRNANQRKEILAQLLGVNQWDRYKEAASERRKLEEGQLGLLDSRLADIDVELAEETDRATALDTAKREYEEITGRLAIQEKLLDQLRRVEEAIKHQRQSVKNLSDNLARSQRVVANLQQTQTQRTQERAGYQTLLDQAETIEANYAAWQTAERKLHDWQAKANAFHAIQQQKRPHELTIERERSRLTQRQRELEAQGQRVATMRAERETVAANVENGRQRLEVLGQQVAKLAEQEAAWHEARAELQRLEGERKLLLQEQTQLQAHARKVEVLQKEQPITEKNLREALAALAAATAETAALAGHQLRHGVALADLDKVKAEQTPLKEAGEKLKDRIERLQAESGSECPLCGQTLTAGHRQAVLAELEAEREQKRENYRYNQSRIQQLTAEIADLAERVKQSGRWEREQQSQQQRQATAEARLAEIERVVTEWQEGGAARLAEVEKGLADQSPLAGLQERVKELSAAAQERARLEKERPDVQGRLSAAEARLAEIERVTAEWDSAGPAELTAVREQLANDQIAPEAQAALVALEKEAAGIGYEAAAHDAARQERDALNSAPTHHQELKQAEAAARPLDDTLADLARQVVEQESHLAELKRQHDEAAAQLETMVAGDGDLAAVEKEVFQLRETQIAANRRVGVAQQKLEVLGDRRKQQAQLTEDRAHLTHRIQRLKLLEKACGRDGVQALLIERALPEIEDYTNELLDRLTGGEMRVMFDTQKALKTADRMAETLDIRIIDGIGERPYANYSGGERFRVDFAIRIALSKVLAKRAGARLQTLVIDEGFGSQDPAGRQRLVEAINTIQEDFARILVITHIDELRDAFPVRIEVEKGTAGSRIRVV